MQIIIFVRYYEWKMKQGVLKGWLIPNVVSYNIYMQYLSEKREFDYQIEKWFILCSAYALFVNLGIVIENIYRQHNVLTAIV